MAAIIYRHNLFGIDSVIVHLKSLAQSALKHSGFRRYAANTTWVIAEQMLRMLAGLLVGIWVARYLGPAQFGLFSYAIAFAALFGSIAKLGLDSILVRDLVSHPERRDVYMGTAFWLKLFGASLMLGIICIAMHFTNSDTTTKLYIFIIASGSVFQAFEVVDFYFQSKVLSKFVSICKLTQLVISSLLKIYLIFVQAELFWFVLVSLVDQATLAITLYWVYRSQKIGSYLACFDAGVARKLLLDSWPLVLSGLVVMIYMRIDQIMIKEMLGEKEVGIYSSAVRLSEIWYFIPTIIVNSVFPSIVSAKINSNSLYITRIQRLYALMFWAALCIAIPMTFLSDHLVAILYGNIYAGAGNILKIHIWAGVFVFLGVASSHWFIVEDLQKYSTFNTIVGAIANISLNILLIPIYGINGAAIATLISYCLAAYLMNYIFLATRENFFRISKSIYTFK